MCCCLFFLFKQKTAYEMRISDWSSDVCSSDLPRNLDSFRNPVLSTQFCAVTLANRTRREKSFRNSKRPSRRLAIRIQTGFAKNGANAGARKIGRASCRERVCQDV